MSDMRLRDALVTLLAQLDAGQPMSVELYAVAEGAREALAETRRHEFFVVIAATDVGKSYRERHPNSTFEDRGPMVWETYVNGATRANAEKHAKRLGAEYGWARVGRVIVEDWPASSEGESR